MKNYRKYKFAAFVAFAAFTVFALGLIGGACVSASPPPAVSVSVDASAQLAIEEEAPVLPDDFAKNDPPRVSAKWTIEPVESVDSKSATSADQKSISRRRNKNELDAWVRKHYTPKTVLKSAVMGDNNLVLIHLVNEHKFTPDQVNGLDMWVALALHDAAHAGTIRADEIVTVTASAAGSGEDSGITLFTSDGTWNCPACNDQKKILSSGKVSFDFKTVKVPLEGNSPTNRVPLWLGADGETFGGSMSVKQLEAWAKLHGNPNPISSCSPAQAAAINEKPVTVVELDGSSSSAVLAALLEHVNRSEIAHKSADGKLAVQSWLPEIDVDLSDPLLAVLDAMMSKDGYQLGGLKVSWPAGKRAMVFDPPVDVAYRKVLEVSSKVKSVEVDGRVVVIRLDGRLINDLKVRLK